VRNALNDADPLVRSAAVTALSGADAGTRAALLPRLLDDPVRQVRMEAGRALAGEPESRLAAQDRAKLARALDEYIAAERLNAGRPAGRANLGNLYAVQGKYEEAIAAYRGAIAIDPTFVQAALNLADVYRTRGLEDEAEKTIREALTRDPRSAAAYHALGLSLVRQKRLPDALKALGEAARLAPDNARFAYVYAVGLNGSGQKQRAIRELEGALKRQPYDRELLLGLTLFNRDAGDRERALGYARQLAELDPDNPQIARIVGELGGMKR
jgi:tetratricopeptide (TPR) repeat protein